MENCFDCKTLQTEKHELAGGWLNAEKNWRREKESLEQRLAAAESRIAELVSGIKEAQIELIETGKIYALGLSCQKRLVTELEQRLAAAESRIAELVSGIKEAQIELIETGNCYEILEKLIEGE